MTTDAARARRTDGGPPLLPVAAATAGLFVAGLVVSAVLSQGAFPSPYEAAATRWAYFGRNADAVRAGAVLQFASAVPLAVLTAAVHARFRHLGVRVAGVTIAFAGGLLASAMLMVSASLQWALSRPESLTDRAVVFTVQDLSFLTGGAAHVVTLGLLVAGVAVPSLLLRLLPRPLAVAGVLLAAVAELSVLSLVWPALSVLLPAARFPILVWLLLVAWRLPRGRAAARPIVSGTHQPQHAPAAGTVPAPVPR